MAQAFLVPTSSTFPWFKQRLTLSGIIYTVNLRYNTRTTHWTMDLLDSSENPILMGIPVLILRDMTSQYPTLTIPKGVFFATDDSGRGLEATLYSFGIDHSLYYIDPTQ